MNCRCGKLMKLSSAITCVSFAIRRQRQPGRHIEALRFLDAIVRFQKVDIKTVISMRVHGASHALYIKKRKLQQAKQFMDFAVQGLWMSGWVATCTMVNK